MMMQNKNNVYVNFADYYDIYANEFDYDLWFKYLKTISGIANYKGKNILDLGCGTGILLLKFAKEGAVMTGVDLSDRMLSIIDQKIFRARTKALLICSDMADFISGSSYDFIYSSCDTVNYLNIDSFEKLLINIGSMLKSGGKFAFDILNKGYFEHSLSEDEFLIRGIKYIFERSVHKDRLFTDVTIIDEDIIIKESHVQYFISSDIIQTLAKRHDLTLCGIWDIYTQKPYTEESDKIQVLIQKA